MMWWACLSLAALASCAGAETAERVRAEVAKKCPDAGKGRGDDLAYAARYLAAHDCKNALWLHYSTLADFTYQTNLTDANEEALLQFKQEQSKFTRQTTSEVNKLFRWKEFEDRNATLFMWFRMLSKPGKSALPNSKFKELNQIQSDMGKVYSTATVCAYKKRNKCDLLLEPDLSDLLTTSRNYDELAHAWKAWRDACGRKLKGKYMRYIQLNNEAAKLNDYADYGEMWREQESVKGLEDTLSGLWREVKPLYTQLHAYARKKLVAKYGANRIQADGPIPAHILGSMWSQRWSEIFEILKPFPKSPALDVTKELQRQKMTVKKMFKMSEDFFTSLGLKAMTPAFWERSVIEKPKDRDIVCHASAWDFFDGEDFRIKMCTQVNMKDFITIHHEMGHIQYYQQYARQPAVFRQGANSGFHEAVGDVLALSVSTPKHLQKIKLLKRYSDDKRSDVTFLLKMALEKVIFLPSAYLYDVWRWKVFSGEIGPDNMNTAWWTMRSAEEGICPPVKRTDADLDPLSKFHVATDVPYIRYFVAVILQFQFHEALCREAGHKGPLHKCDIYQSKKAGRLLSRMLRLGTREPWQEQVALLTRGRTDELSAKPLLRYFEPLEQWLREQNRGAPLGWPHPAPDPTLCPGAALSGGAQEQCGPVYVAVQQEE